MGAWERICASIVEQLTFPLPPAKNDGLVSSDQKHQVKEPATEQQKKHERSKSTKERNENEK